MGAIKGAGSIEAGISIVQSFVIYYVYSDELDKEYSNYSWQLDKNGKPVDVPVKKDDHLMDSIRYVITFLYDFLRIKI